MTTILRYLFFLVIVRPIIMIVLGLNIRRRDLLPSAGPAIIVANHNSHLDTMVLMTIFPSSLLKFVKPVAAADYFLRSGPMAWFSTNIIGIIPLARQKAAATETLDDRLAGVYKALRNKEIVILFPEGSRGEPEKLTEFKSGIAHIAAKVPHIPVYPVFMHGLGKALPKGEALLVPFFCDVFVGEPFSWTGDRVSFMKELTRRMNDLQSAGYHPEWE